MQTESHNTYRVDKCNVLSIHTHIQKPNGARDIFFAHPNTFYADIQPKTCKK